MNKIKNPFYLSVTVTILGLVVILITIFSEKIMMPAGGSNRIQLSADTRNLKSFGEVLPSASIQQNINCGVSTLKSIRILSATYARANTSHLQFTLTNGTELTEGILINARQVKDNSWIEWVLDRPILDCDGKSLTLRISSPDATSGDALTFFYRPSYYSGQLISPSTLQGQDVQLVLELNKANALTAVKKAEIEPLAIQLAIDHLKAEITGAAILGEVLPQNKIVQQLKCPVTKINTVSFLVATYARLNTSKYEISILHDKKTLERLTLDSTKAKDNDWFTLPLQNPITDCQNKELTVMIETKNAKVGNALTFYTLPKYYVGEMSYDIKRPQTGRQLAIEINRK